MIISRSCRFAAVCLMTAALTMTAMSGAIAAADSESDSTSGASEESSSSSGSDATTTTDHNITTTTATGADQPSSTVSAQTYTSASSSDSTDTTSSAGAASEDLSSTDHNVTTTTVSGTGPSSTLSAQTNTSTSTSDSTDTTSASSDDPATTTGVQNQTSSLSAQGDETSSTTTSGSDSATSDAPTESDTAESTTLSTSATTETVTSDVVTTNSVAVTEAAAPTLQYAIAYLLRTLATTAINLVDAILQLPADIRAALGISWATPTVASYRALLLSTTPNVVLLNLIAPSSVPVGAPGAVSAAPTIYRSIEVDGGITLLAAALQPQAAAPAFIAAMRSGHSVTGLIADAVTAVAVTVSIWALVYAALPGLGGLVSFGAVGVRIGYRQSSAGIALLTPDLARFMRPGPIGVVRSGSLVSIHHRTAAADRTTRHIERVA
ncbi:hypothetical protein MMAG44476_02355 [Mycolicibacterium mageritense DSM 44476 = CIP 104973]|nr:hypothetical protein BN978_00768 [Mycolicibacterium mageritense DSM 44476 = CIP 104973]